MQPPREASRRGGSKGQQQRPRLVEEVLVLLAWVLVLVLVWGLTVVLVEEKEGEKI